MLWCILSNSMLCLLGFMFLYKCEIFIKSFMMVHSDKGTIQSTIPWHKNLLGAWEFKSLLTYLLTYMLAVTTASYIYSAAGSKELTIASTVIRNGSGLRLPSSSNGYVCFIYWKYINCNLCVRTALPQVPASPIFSLQINPLPDPSVLVKNPIVMMFDVVRKCCINQILLHSSRCVS